MTSSSQEFDEPDTLWGFIETLIGASPIVPTGEDPPWFEPGRVCEIDQQTYWSFLELLPPRWIDGDWFACGEGTGPFRLFWQVGDTYFARQLTDDETSRFCRLSRTSLAQ